MTTEQKTLEVKICRACNQHRKNDKPISKQLDKFNLTFVLVKQAQCEVCKGGK